MTDQRVAGWVSLHQRAMTVLGSFSTLKEQLSGLQQRRVLAIRDAEQKQLDQRIAEKNEEAMAMLRDCAGMLDSIQREQIQDQDDAVLKMRDNIVHALAASLQDRTKQLRAQQKRLFDSLESHAPGDAEFLKLTPQQELKMADEDFSGDELVQLDVLIADERNREISALVGSINELSDMFREMGRLILEQGTLLDRIDYNLEQTVEHCERAQEQLVKADEHQKNNCGNKFIVFEIVLILALCLVLVFKKAF